MFAEKKMTREPNVKILYYDIHLPFLINDSERQVGGATVQLFAWLQGLINNKQKVGVLTFKGASDLVGKSLPFLLIDTHKLNGGIPVLRWFYDVIPNLYRRIKYYKPEFIIKAGAGFQVGILTLICKYLDIPFIYRVANDADVDERINQRVPLYSRFLFNFGLKYSAAVICQNQYQIIKIREIYPEKPSILLYNPFFSNGNMPEVKTFENRKYVAWVGVFSMKKNPALLLDIVKIHKNLEFRIAGKLSTHIDNKTKAIFEKLEKQQNVKFVGYVKRHEILSFLSEAYFLLNTSLYEGFSNTYLEALSMGTPVVTSSKNDPDGIIGKNNLGVVIDEHKSEDDFRGVLTKASFDLMSTHSREYVLKNHNPDNLAKELINFLDKIKKKNS